MCKCSILSKLKLARMNCDHSLFNHILQTLFIKCVKFCLSCISDRFETWCIHHWATGYHLHLSSSSSSLVIIFNLFSDWFWQDIHDGNQLRCGRRWGAGWHNPSRRWTSLLGDTRSSAMLSGQRRNTSRVQG